jgi:hypothetical protein
MTRTEKSQARANRLAEEGYAVGEHWAHEATDVLAVQRVAEAWEDGGVGAERYIEHLTAAAALGIDQCDCTGLQMRHFWHTGRRWE